MARSSREVLEVASKPGRNPFGDAHFDPAFRVDRRVGGPLGRRRGRQDGSRAATGLDEPAHQVVVRLLPLRFFAEPVSDLTRRTAEKDWNPCKRRGSARMIAPGLGPRHVVGEFVPVQVELPSDKPTTTGGTNPPGTSSGPSSRSTHSCSANTNRFFCRLLGRSSGRWLRPRDLTEDSVLARNGPGFVRRIVALQLPRVIPASQPLHHQSLAREHDEHLVVQRLGPAHVQHDQIAVANRQGDRVTRHPAHTSHAPGAPLRPAPTAPPTPSSPWSRPTRARRTRARIGRSPRMVRPRLAFPPRRTRPPAFARAAPTSRSVTDRQRDTASWRPCVHRGLRSWPRPDRRSDPVMDSRKRRILKGERHAPHVYRHQHRDSRFWRAARTRMRRRWRTSVGCSTSNTLKFDRVKVSMRSTCERAAPRRVGRRNTAPFASADFSPSPPSGRYSTLSGRSRYFRIMWYR